jgi:hypothetical protein
MGRLCARVCTCACLCLSVSVCLHGWVGGRPAHATTDVVFDKTGTLTAGSPVVHTAVSLAPDTEQDPMVQSERVRERVCVCVYVYIYMCV